MRAVVDVLTAEIPDMQRDRGLPPVARQLDRLDRDAMGRLALGFERFALEIAAELRLADAPVAEDHQLDVLDA
jgi:hypothetical protein